MVDFVLIMISGMVLVVLLFYGGKFMAAMDNLNQAITDLNNTIANVNMQSQDPQIQAAADAVNAANEELKKRVTPV